MSKKTKFNDSFTNKEIKLIDKLIDKSIKKGQIVDEEALMKALK